LRQEQIPQLGPPRLDLQFFHDGRNAPAIRSIALLDVCLLVRVDEFVHESGHSALQVLHLGGMLEHHWRLTPSDSMAFVTSEPMARKAMTRFYAGFVAEARAGRIRILARRMSGRLEARQHIHKRALGYRKAFSGRPEIRQRRL